MSSRATTPEVDDNDPLSDVYGAMAQSSPISPPHSSRLDKRPHSAVDDENSDNEGSPMQTASTCDQNVVVAATRYAEWKRLKRDQTAALDAFLQDPASLREAKLLVHLMVIENQIEKIVTATAPYRVSADLEKNIQNYAAAVLLSSKILTYKGTVTTNILLEILKKHRFDLPAGIEHNLADFSKVIAAAQEVLTQKRSKFKKLIKYSLKPHDSKSVENPPAADHLNIFQLAQAFIDGTQCSVNVPLCARVALMRKVYLKESGQKFWDKVDTNLANIRKHANGDSKKIAKAFRHILSVDQDAHGSKDYQLDDEKVDGFQQEVDDVINANLVDAATSA
ncbi:hypothetical protein B0H10DRAFT_1950308 [Mycena sp. CBHHK59/15]|nr:hypothetical protein B0H10DRAFT_1950308 [Mycena sp. CBHHK59/15]